MAPIGRVGLAFLLVLTLGAVRDGALAQTPQFALYDDFSSPRLDPAKWASVRESVREIRDGVLVLAAGGSAYTDANANTTLRHVSPPTNLTSLQADVRLTAATAPVGGWSRLRLRGAFYNDGTAGTDSLGDVWAQTGLRVGTAGTPEVFWGLYRCNDANCNTTGNAQSGAFLPAAFDQTYTVAVAWDGSQFTFTATPAGGSPTNHTVTPPLPPAGGPPRTGQLILRAEATGWDTAPGTEGGYTAGTFDNVYINGTPYDDFNGPAIDPAKWRDYEVIRELTDGALTLRTVTPAGKSPQGSYLRITNPNAVTTLAADVTVTGTSFDAPNDWGQAGIGGSFYNTGTGTTAGDVNAEVKYWTNGSGSGSVHFTVWRSGLGIFTDSLIPTFPVNEPHWLFINWDGAVFTYGVDTLVRTFDPQTQAPVARPPVNPSRYLYSGTGSGGGTSTLTATFDNVAVNPEALQALPGLRPGTTTLLAGDVAAAGIGLRGTGDGTITLSSLPANATVQQAWLYWATLGWDGTFTGPTLNGVSVSGELIGRGDDPAVGAHQSYAYRADVTGLVTGNGSYGLAGLPADTPTTNDSLGASLVVLYTVPDAPLRQVAISDGVATLTTSRLPAVRAPLPALWAVDPVSARLILLAGDGEVGNGYSVRDYAGLNSTLLATDGFQGTDGAAWDTKTYDASTALTAGATGATAVVSTASDTIVWVAAVLSTAIQSPALTVTIAGTGSVTSEPTGISCPGDCSEAFPAGTPVTLTATPAAGSSFTGWSGAACDATPTCSVTVQGAERVIATFTLQTFPLTVTNSGGGTVTSAPAGIDCGSTCSAPYDYGTTVTLTATPAPGASFAGWSGACSGTGTCTVAMTAARNVTASFNQPLTVTKAGTGSGIVSSTPAGINCGADCNEAYPHGTPVTLDATPSIGSTFAGWSGDCSGTGTCTVTMDAPKSVTATFILIPPPTSYPLTITKAGSGTGRVTSSPPEIDCGPTCTASLDVGVPVTLTATPDSGSAFTGWAGAGCTGTAPCAVTMSQAWTVTATFTQMTPVSGILPTTIWPASGSPYVLTGNVLVPAGATLTIEPGVEVRAERGLFLRVEGTLIADGTATQPIRFTSNAAPPAPGDWQGIIFAPSSTAATLDGTDGYLSGSILRYVEVVFGGGIYLDESFPYLAQLSLHDNTGYGAVSNVWPGAVRFRYTTNPDPTKTLILRDSTIQNNPAWGISGEVGGGAPPMGGAPAGSAQLLSNTVANNTAPMGGGLWVRQDSPSFTLQIAGNTVSGNTGFFGVGLRVSAGGPVLVEDNSFLNNTASSDGGGAGIGIENGNPVIRRNLFQGNLIRSGPTDPTAAAGSGLALWGSGAPQVTSNTFAANAGGQATLWLAQGGTPGTLLQHNNFEGNTGPYEVYLAGNAGRRDVDARFNYWGTTDPTVISARLFDYYDDFIPGIVDFSEFLLAPEAGAGVNTPVGVNVPVQPRDTATGTTPATLNFPSVTQPGVTSLTTSSSGPPGPTGFQLGSPATYYELTTTAVYTGPISVCINYTGVSFTDESTLRLFHYEGSSWVDRTTSLDTVAKVICAGVTSLSPFAIFKRVDTTPPVIGPVTDLTVEAASAAGAGVTFTVTATDAVDPAPVVTASPASGSTFPLGTTTVTVTAQDRSGNTSTRTFTVTVRDTTPPALTVPGPITKEATAPLTPAALGTATAVDLVDGPVAATNDAPTAGFPVGTTVVTWSATDHRGNTATATQQVTITDTTPPLVTLSLTPGVLWTPNHALVTITPTVTASDLAGPVAISGPTVTSNEPVDGLGDGDTSPDWIVRGTYDVQLCAERSGTGNGRIYTVTYVVTDLAGNSTTVSATVLVPKSQGE